MKTAILLSLLLVFCASPRFCESASSGAQETETVEKSKAAEGLPLSGRYALQVEGSLTQKELYDVVEKMGPMGIAEVFSVPTEERKITAQRLWIADFPDEESAKKRFAKLKAIKESGFILRYKERTYSLYASSYFDEKAALRDQARLAKLGIPTTLKPVPVTLPAFILIVGSFPSVQAAREKALALQRLHLKMRVIENPQDASQ